MFIDKYTGGGNDRLGNKRKRFGRILTNGEFIMVRSFDSTVRMVAAFAVNAILLLSVGAGVVYAIAPTIA
jgi:hypothetical protein